MIATLGTEVFSTELLPCEKIEWAGRPNPSVTFHRDDCLRIPLSLLVGAFTVFWFLGATGLGGWFSHPPSAEISWVMAPIGACSVLYCQYLIWGRFLYMRWEKERTHYALANRRALIAKPAFNGRSFSSAYLGNLPMIDKEVRMDGIGAISFGGPLIREWKRGRNDPPRPLKFIDLDNADAVYQIVMRLQDQAISRDSR